MDSGKYFVWFLLIEAYVLCIACQLICWLITRNQNPPNNVNPRQREDLAQFSDPFDNILNNLA